MANKYNASGVPSLSKIPPQIYSGYKLVGSPNMVVNAGIAGVEWLDEGSNEAQYINKAAQNVSAPIDQFSQISGALRIRGAEKIAAIKSTEQLYSNLNNMLWGQNVQGMAQLEEYGFDIISNENGTADVPATMMNIARDFPQMAPKAQSKLIETLGLDSNSIELLREGVRLNDLLTKASDFGLTIDPELNARLSELNSQTTELGVAWDGLKGKVSNFGYKIAVSDGSIADGIGGITDLLTRGPDNFSIMRTMGVISGDESEKMRWAYNNDDFKRQLNWYESIMLNSGFMTDGFRKKFQDYYHAKSAVQNSYKDIGSFLVHKSSQTESNPLINSFNLGGEPHSDENIFDKDVSYTWSNNRLAESDGENPYSLLPSHSIYPDSNIVAPPASISPIYAEQMSDFNFTAIADVIATAMQNNRVQIELTLIDGRTGETSVVLGQGGGRITYAMAMPM
ncbi:chemotaxis protein [Yersinia enterocolitica]|nr:chemotaxis protein [Yersinia enterocolitica]EKN6111927.1 chemotaxis protein [Yersinia enterocolitica]